MKILTFLLSSVVIVSIIYFFGWLGVLVLLSILITPFVIIFIIGMNRGLKPRTTDYKAALKLNEHMPLSSRKLQDILVQFADGEYPIYKLGVKSKALGLDEELKILLMNLKTELEVKKDSTAKDVLMAFVLEFSKVFPNWQNEYRELIDYIENSCFMEYYGNKNLTNLK